MTHTSEAERLLAEGEHVCGNCRHWAFSTFYNQMPGGEGMTSFYGGFSRSAQILAWAIRTFGPVAANRAERGGRLVEEAIELAQAAGVTLAQVQRIAERTYSRPVGDLSQEIGQVGMTLEALAELLQVDIDAEIECEWRRVQALPQSHWKRRHTEKVKQGTAGLE